jgi:hypothetical protein
MSSPSPGPGWWMASDGQWYPQQWEYFWCTRSGSDAIKDMGEKADELGRQGWEMVNISTTTSGMGTQINPTRWFSVVCFFKRPLKPGS